MFLFFNKMPVSHNIHISVTWNKKYLKSNFKAIKILQFICKFCLVKKSLSLV